MNFTEICAANIREIQTNLTRVDRGQVDQFIVSLKGHTRLFTFGKGRSGLVMEMFANRLMHLGFPVHCVGEPTTPAIGLGDLLILGSGSGRTEGCLLAAKQARTAGAHVALFTASSEVPLLESIDFPVIIPGRTRLDRAGEGRWTLAGSIFEEGLLIVCDSICARLAIDFGKTSEDVMKLHANLE